MFTPQSGFRVVFTVTKRERRLIPCVWSSQLVHDEARYAVHPCCAM
jgi:hypothetical protein